MSITIEDRTGEPERPADYDESIRIVTKFLMSPEMMKLPPELSVNLPMIRRCLTQGLALTLIREELIAWREAQGGTPGKPPGDAGSTPDSPKE